MTISHSGSIPPPGRRQFTENLLQTPAVLVFLFLLASPAGWAHDFWIEPQAFQLQPGTKAPLRLFVGQDFKGDSVPYFPQKYERYIAAGSTGTQSILGVLGDDPAGTVMPSTAGIYTIGLHTKPESVSFDTAEEFESYLEKEGLERNLALHRQRFKPGKKIEETYFRCAKSLIKVGTVVTGRDRVLGFPLELIAETNPYHTRTLRLRLLYQDRPLSDALVVAFSKTEPTAKLKGRTDVNGRVEFIIPRPGVWLVTSVHMVPAPFLSGFDWKSAWASLTFERP
ncbi:MAG: DUF4198 domain-containing protein [Gammaproteobacteria bacterium]|nr:DUF4198 domain-containing protein [Gammaproteobacteria bacterium]MDH3406536.1 DUF4198 domain-containing protein [Gammaproteobacteria bacterium]